MAALVVGWHFERRKRRTVRVEECEVAAAVGTVRKTGRIPGTEEPETEPEGSSVEVWRREDEACEDGLWVAWGRESMAAEVAGRSVRALGGHPAWASGVTEVFGDEESDLT